MSDMFVNKVRHFFWSAQTAPAPTPGQNRVANKSRAFCGILHKICYFCSYNPQLYPIFGKSDIKTLQMSKLQLYITKSGSTYSSLLNLNPSEETGRYVRNLSKVVELIDYDAEEKNVFYLLSATDEGTFFTILRTVPPVKGHHIAEWIFVPGYTEISGEDLYNLVALMTRKASLPRMTNADVAEVRAAFATEYHSNPDAPRLTACRGTEYAWRSYGPASGLTLRDFTGRGRWQQAYIPFAGVLLVDDELGYSVDAASLADTTIGDPAVILPPQPGDDNFSAYVFNRRLEHPLRATLGESVTITWRRNGFEDITVTETIDTPEFTPVPPDTTGSHKLITPSSFYVTAQGGPHTSLRDCRIRVNGVDITAKGHPFTAEDLQHAAVSVACDGFVTFNGTMDLASTTRALISLKEQSKVYCFELPLVNSDYGTPVRFELHTKKQMTHSPIDGYILLDDIQEGPARTNYLGYSGGGSKLTTKLMYIGIGLVLGIVLMLLTGHCSGSKDDSGKGVVANTEQAVAGPSNTSAAPSGKDNAAKPAAKPAAKQTGDGFAEALKYLNDNEKWTKADLEKYEATKGLFDDLNNYNTEAIYSKWGPRFKDSPRMQKIVTHLKQGTEKRKRKKVEAPYNKRADDTTIAVQTYLNIVDP